MEKKEMRPFDYSKKFAKQKIQELDGCSINYIVENGLDIIFIWISVYYPETFDKMLDYLKLKEDEK